MAVSEKTIETSCPHCRHMCRSKVTAIGKKIVCGKCGYAFETVKFAHASLFRQFCTIAVKNFLISEPQLDAIISQQKSLKQQGHGLSYEEMFVDKGLMTTEQKNRLMAASVRKLNKMLVQLAVEKKYITTGEGEAALAQQAMDFQDNRITLVGDILVARGYLKKGQRTELLDIIEKGGSYREEQKQDVLLDDSGKYPLLGMVAVEKDIVTKTQLDQVLETMPKEKESACLEDVLCESGMISYDDRDRLVLKTLKRIDKELGKIVMDRKLVSKEDLTAIASHQADLFKQYRYISLMDLLVARKILDDSALEPVYAGLTSISRPQAMALIKKGQAFLSRLEERREKNRPHNRETPGESLADGDATPPVEPEIVLSIDEDLQNAYIILSSSLTDLTIKSLADIVKDVKQIVADRGISFGIIADELIDACIQASIFKDRRFRVASGVSPIPGKSGEIHYHFETDYLKAGVITEEGIIDFRDRGDLPFVRKDDLLATLIPPVEGTSGCDIYGHAIDVPAVDALTLQSGAGTRLSEDKLTLYADIDGRPELLINGDVAVYSEITIRGDVNFETGHIDFKGNINIQGTICEGFRVRGVNVVAQNITGGMVKASGNVDISGGVVDAVIRADGHVQAMYVTGTRVDAYGDLFVVKEIIDSDVRLSGMCKSERCKVISSSLSARMGVLVNQIGTDVSAPCRIRSGTDDHLDTLIQSFKEQLEEITRDTEKHQVALEAYHDSLRGHHQKMVDIAMHQETLAADINRLKIKADRLKSSGNIKKIDRTKKELETVCGELKHVSSSFAAVFAHQDRDLDAILARRKVMEHGIRKIESVNETIRLLADKRNEKQGVVKVTVNGQIVSRTVVSGRHASIILQEDLKNVTITEIRKVDQEGKGAVRWEMEVKKAS